eukprot:COSAG02_NODE_20527_length_827_cov_0.891484_1_plen_21_part_10
MVPSLVPRVVVRTVGSAFCPL